MDKISQEYKEESSTESKLSDESKTDSNAEATSDERAAKIWRAEEQLLQLLAGLRTAGLGSECAAVRIGEGRAPVAAAERRGG